MKGYADDYSMSLNAEKAYARGMLPASKMVALLKQRYPRSFHGLSVELFQEVVPYTEWHHTSLKKYRTKFYSFDTVFEYRSDLKELLRSRREAKAATRAALAKLKKSGRWVVYNDSSPLEDPEAAARYPWFMKAAQATLALTEEEYLATLRRQGRWGK